MISKIISGASLKQAIEEYIRILKLENNYKEKMNLVESAILMANERAPAPEVIQEIGEDWIAEEALGISLYCSLVADSDFKKAVLLSVKERILNNLPILIYPGAQASRVKLFRSHS